MPEYTDKILTTEEIGVLSSKLYDYFIQFVLTTYPEISLSDAERVVREFQNVVNQKFDAIKL